MLAFLHSSAAKLLLLKDLFLSERQAPEPDVRKQIVRPDEDAQLASFLQG
jgi:hypothetical protein